MGKKDEKKKVATGGGGGQGAKRKAMYAAQFGITDKNKRRKLRRHCKAYPGDLAAMRVYGARYSA